MKVDYVKNKLEKSGINYVDLPGVSFDTIHSAEERLGLSFPKQIVCFYKFMNGLKVKDPKFEIFPIDDLTLNNGNEIHFCSYSENQGLIFKTDNLNVAKEWDIYDIHLKSHITLTFASFWSNKMWKWLLKQELIE